MLTITQGREDEYGLVRAFYHRLIEKMQDLEYKPGWEKEVYPADDYLREALRTGTLYLGRLEGRLVSAMIVNHASNEGYRQVTWPTPAEEDQVTVIHALGAMPDHSGKGLAKEMVREALRLARESGQKVVRLDVLTGNLPAEKLYIGLGFRYVDTVSMFYEDTGWTDFLLYEYPL